MQNDEQAPPKPRKTAEDRRKEVLEDLRKRSDKSLSREQKLALYIAGLSAPSDEDQRMLRTLLDAERSAIAARKKKAAASKIYNDVKEQKRRDRTRHLIELGGLFTVAGVQETNDTALIVGMLSSMNGMTEETKTNIRERGHAVLATHEAKKKQGD